MPPTPPDEPMEEAFDQEAPSTTMTLDESALELIQDDSLGVAEAVPVRIPTAPPAVPMAAAVPARASTVMATPPPPPTGAAPPALPVAAAASPWPPAEEDTGALVAEVAADWAARAAELRAELDAERDKARAALFAYELGELTERRLGDEATAVKLYGKALAGDPSLRPNLWAIRRVFYRRALWPNLIKLIDAELRFAGGDEERADLLVEKGHVLEDRLKDVSAARDAYDKALALAPEHAGALLARERLALADQDDERLAELWRRLADQAQSPARKAMYLVDLAQLAARREGEAGVQEALELVAEALALGVDRARLARLRERLAERADDPEALLGALEVRVALAVEAFGPGGPTPAPSDLPGGDVAQDRAAQLRQEIVACRRRGAQVAAGAGDPERAWKLLEQAAALVPGEPLLLMDLAGLAEATGRHEDLAALCTRLAALDGDPGRQLALALRRADALVRAGKPEEADAVLDHALALAPGYYPVLAARQRRALAEAGGPEEGRAAALERLASLLVAEAAAARLGTAFGPGVAVAPDPAWAAAAYVAAGDLYALRLGRDADARAAYGQALEAQPGHGAALWAQVHLLEKAGEAASAAELLEAEAARLSGAEADTPEGARLEDVLERLVALYRTTGQGAEALVALRRLAERRPDDRLLAFRVVDLAADAGQEGDRVAALARLADAEEDPARKAALCAEIGRVHAEALGQPDAAIEAYRRALAADPDHHEAAAALAELLRAAGRWEELAQARRAEAAATTDPARAVDALREAAAVLWRRMGQGAEAAAVLAELLDREPGDAAALTALVAVTAGPSIDPEAHLAALDRRAERETAETGLGRTLLESAEALEAAGRPVDAAVAAQRAAEAGGVGLHAAWTLFWLAATGQAGVDASSALDGLIAARPADDALAALVREEQAYRSLAEPEAAAEQLAALAGDARGGPGVHLGRALVAARRRDAAGLAEALAAWGRASVDPRVSAALLLRAATLTENPAESAELAAAAVRARPDDAGAVLEAAERGPAPSMKASERAALLERRVAAAPPALARVLDLERAEEAEALGRLADAGRLLGRVLAAHPDDREALWALARVARRAGDGETLARALFRLGQTLADPEAAAARLREAAELLEKDLGRPADAARVWRALLERVPEHAEAFERAHELFEAAGGDGAEALIELLGHRLRHAVDSATEVPARVERAALLADRQDWGGAAADLERVLAVDDTHAGALAALADVREKAGDPAGAAALWQRFIDTGARGPAARRARLTLAALHLRDGRAQAAADVLGENLAADESDLESREQLVVALEALGDTARLAVEVAKLAGQRGAADERARDERRAARLYRERGDDAAARQALERARAHAPLDLELSKELAGLLSGGERQAMLRAALGEAREAHAAGRRGGTLALIVGLAELAGDAALARVAGSAAVALGEADGAAGRAQAERTRAALAASAVPATPVDLRARLRLPALDGPWHDVWVAVADAVATQRPHDASGLGFARADKVAVKTLARSWPELETWLAVVGRPEVELHISAGRAGAAVVVPGEPPHLYLGADVARAEGSEGRARLGRVLAALAEDAGPLYELDDADAAGWLAAAAKLGGVDVAGASGERVKLLGKQISRRGKKALPAAAARLGGAAGDPLAFVRAARAFAARFAVLVGGDVGAAAAAAGMPGGPDAELVAWALSDAHLQLRKEVGLP